MSRTASFYRTPDQSEIEHEEMLSYLEWYQEQKEKESNNKKQNKMKAEEKAKELVDKYWKIDTNNDYWSVSLELGKKMADIAVDEIIKECYRWTGQGNGQWENGRLEYWERVKYEIKKYLR